MYDGYLKRVAQSFEAEFDEIDAVHGFEHGPEFEIALCKALRRVLPMRFGVVRGYVVDRDDRLAGDDIIIFEKMGYPTLQLRDDELARKEKVPIEAVYAYIEAKHAVNIAGDDGQSLAKAVDQVAQVKRLCSSREAVSFQRIGTSNVRGVTITGPVGFPGQRNPVFAAVLARHVRNRKGGQILEGEQDAEKVLKLLQANVSMPQGAEPDLLVLGSDTVALPVIKDPGGSEHNAYHSPFFIPGSSQSSVLTTPSLAFGIGLASLMFALDWMQLGQMPWKPILADEAGLVRAANSDSD